MVSDAEENELVSIVMPVFNGARYLRATLASVRAQTYPHWELLATLDPATSDESWQILESAARADARIQAMRAPQAGVSATRNEALSRARGRWLAFLDADDLWLERKLELQLRWMSARNVGLSATWYRRIDHQGRRTGRLMRVPLKLDRKRLLKQNCLCCSSVMLDRDKTGEIRFEDVGCEDFALWLNVLEACHAGETLPIDLVRYRVVPDSRGASKIKTAGESWRILKREQGVWPAALGFAGFLARGAWKHSRF